MGRNAPELCGLGVARHLLQDYTHWRICLMRLSTCSPFVFASVLALASTACATPVDEETEAVQQSADEISTARHSAIPLQLRRLKVGTYEVSVAEGHGRVAFPPSCLASGARTATCPSGEGARTAPSRAPSAGSIELPLSPLLNALDGEDVLPTTVICSIGLGPPPREMLDGSYDIYIVTSLFHIVCDW